MSQLERISLSFPTNTENQRQTFQGLNKLIGTKNLNTSGLENYFPQLMITDATDSLVSLATDGTPIIRFSNVTKSSVNKLMPFQEILEKFDGHIVRVDHLGINLPKEDLNGKQLLNFLSKSTNTYAYPGGEPWYFTVPATSAEFEEDIADFSQIRFPKFELVLEGSESTPHVIQVDFETNLSREEVEARLPAPFGVTLPELEIYFRSVFVEHPWDGFLLRMDFRYHSDELINDWTTGKWLVEEGTRLS